MGTELIGDIWLHGLILPKMPSSKAAASLLRAQILTFNRRGHLLAYSDEFPRKMINRDVNKGRIPRCYVRCSRCGCVAFIADWVAAATFTEEQRLSAIDSVVAKGGNGRADFLRPCPGNEYVEGILALIDGAHEGR